VKEKKIQNDKNTKPKPELVHFSWGGKTQEWEEEADQIMNYLQDQLDRKEIDDEKKSKIRYGKRKQYW
jgi:hypothetical protein